MRAWSFAALLLAAGCATTGAEVDRAEDPGAPVDAAKDQAQAEAPGHKEAAPAEAFDLEAAMAREAAPLPLLAIQAPDGAFTSRVEAKGPPSFSAQGEGMQTVEVPVGTESRLTCFTYDKRIDPAGALELIVRAVAKEVEPKAVLPTAVKAVGGQPVLFARLDYVAQAKVGRVFGQLKLAVSGRDDVSFLCMHDEAGYHASFERWVEAFGTHLHRAGFRPEPTRFVEIQAVKLNDQPVGFSHRLVYANGEGRAIETFSSMLLPRTATALLASDSATVEKTNAEGRIDQVSFRKALNGEINADVSVARAKGGYDYKGTWEKKPIDGHFDTKAALAGDVLHWRLTRELLAGSKEKLEVPGFSPSLDPTGITLVRYQKDGQERGVQVDVGPMRFNAVADEHGVLEETRLPMGRLSILTERIFSRGAP